MSEITEKISDLFELASELERMYPGRHFTPDGHMIGSIGEVIAAEEYDHELLKRPTLFMMRRQKMGSRSR